MALKYSETETAKKFVYRNGNATSEVPSLLPSLGLGSLSAVCLKHTLVSSLMQRAVHFWGHHTNYKCNYVVNVKCIINTHANYDRLLKMYGIFLLILSEFHNASNIFWSY